MSDIMYCVVATYSDNDYQSRDVKGVYLSLTDANNTAKRWRRCLNGFWVVEIWTLRPLSLERIKF